MCFTCLCTLGFCLPIPVSGKCGFTQVQEHRKSKYQASTRLQHIANRNALPNYLAFVRPEILEFFSVDFS